MIVADRACSAVATESDQLVSDDTGFASGFRNWWQLDGVALFVLNSFADNSTISPCEPTEVIMACLMNVIEQIGRTITTIHQKQMTFLGRRDVNLIGSNGGRHDVSLSASFGRRFCGQS